MKGIVVTLLLLVIGVVLGYGIGYGLGVVEYANTEEHFFSNQWGTVGQYGDGSAGVLSVADGTERELGVLAPGKKYRVEFLVENTGGSEIILSLKEKSDNIEVDLTEDYTLIASTSYPIELNFVAPDQPGDFKGFAVIQTTDPNPERRETKLTVSGTIKPSDE